MEDDWYQGGSRAVVDCVPKCAALPHRSMLPAGIVRRTVDPPQGCGVVEKTTSAAKVRILATARRRYTAGRLKLACAQPLHASAGL